MRDAPSTQTSFTSGEIDPRLKGRIEVTRYYAGAALMRNVLVRPTGGVVRRPGMRHCATLANGADGVRLLPFAFNTEQTYAIAFTANTFAVFLADGTPVATVGGCPWTAAQAATFAFAQSADTLLLFHPDLPPQRIRRGASNAIWTRDDLPLVNIPTFNFGAGAEPVISATRGWPSCGTFFQGRLWLGGLRSRPATVLASRVGDFFNFDKGTGLDDQAIDATVQSDEVNAIEQIFAGRNLQIFTVGSEWAITVAPPITPTNIAFDQQTRRGIKRRVPVAEVDGAVLFVQRGGAALRQSVFQDVEQAYRADLLSLLAPHLIKDPVQLAARKGARGDDADNVLLVNADGTVSVLTTLRAQEIAAFSRWETDGNGIRSACALASGEVFFATLRAGAIRIERWDEAQLMDASVRQAAGTSFSAVAGLGHLEGRSVAIVADGAFVGTATVASGQVTLPRPASVAEVGLPVPVRIQTMPFEPRAPTGALIGRRARITSIIARLQACGTFTIEGYPVIARAFGVAPGTPLDTAPPLLTGDVKLRGLPGWRERIEIDIAQPDPAPFQLLALAYDAMVQT